LRVDGTVLQITKSGAGFEGLIFTPDQKAISFRTQGATKGIVEDSSVTFVGLLVGQHNFPNVSGGQTQSLMLAGHFLGQEWTSTFSVPRDWRNASGGRPPWDMHQTTTAGDVL